MGDPRRGSSCWGCCLAVTGRRPFCDRAGASFLRRVPGGLCLCEQKHLSPPCRATGDQSSGAPSLFPGGPAWGRRRKQIPFQPGRAKPDHLEAVVDSEGCPLQRTCGTCAGPRKRDPQAAPALQLAQGFKAKSEMNPQACPLVLPSSSSLRGKATRSSGYGLCMTRCAFGQSQLSGGLVGACDG